MSPRNIPFPRRVRAPAKLNLALDILGRREDGYHDLRMVMQTVSLCDTLTVERQAEGFTLQAEGPFLPKEGKTLEQRAAEAFFAALDRPLPGLRVTLDKTLPAYAGLGGGSSDVAALLRVLRNVYAPELDGDALERIGLEVGSDVPFCLRGGTALAEGRGERLTDLPPLPECGVVVCKPDFGLPTPALFARADAVSLHTRPDIDGMRSALEQGDLRGVADRLCNVFEEVLPEDRRAEVFAIKGRLIELGAMNAAMSGSGPAVFGLFRDFQEAERCAAVLHRDYRETFPARPVGKIH